MTFILVTNQAYLSNALSPISCLNKEFSHIQLLLPDNIRQDFWSIPRTNPRQDLRAVSSDSSQAG